MLFSKTTSYGTRALAYLAGQPEGRLCGLQEIAESERIPPVYLRKVLGELRRQRILRSVKGIHGGYELARPPQTITLWEVFRALEPDPYLDKCFLGCGSCDTENATCAFHDEWKKLREELIGLLQGKTISQIAEVRACRAAEPVPEAEQLSV